MFFESMWAMKEKIYDNEPPHKLMPMLKVED